MVFITRCAVFRWLRNAGRRSLEISQRRRHSLVRWLAYRYGYFTQRFNREGWQEEHYGDTHPEELPLQQVKDDDGTPLAIEVLIRKRKVCAQVWRAAVGHVQLYLLDTNIPENVETDRWVTGHLYGGDRETRIVQEMLLGIGGVRLLRLGVTTSIIERRPLGFSTLELGVVDQLAGSILRSGRSWCARLRVLAHSSRCRQREFDPEWADVWTWSQESWDYAIPNFCLDGWMQRIKREIGLTPSQSHVPVDHGVSVSMVSVRPWAKVGRQACGEIDTFIPNGCTRRPG